MAIMTADKYRIEEAETGFQHKHVRTLKQFKTHFPKSISSSSRIQK